MLSRLPTQPVTIKSSQALLLIDLRCKFLYFFMSATHLNRHTSESNETAQYAPPADPEAKASEVPVLNISDAMVAAVAKKILGDVPATHLEGYERGQREGSSGRWEWVTAGFLLGLNTIGLVVGAEAIWNPRVIDETKDMLSRQKTARGLQPFFLHISTPKEKDSVECSHVLGALSDAATTLHKMDFNAVGHETNKTICIDDFPDIKPPNFYTIVKNCEDTPSFSQIALRAVEITSQYPLCSKARKKY